MNFTAQRELEIKLSADRQALASVPRALRKIGLRCGTPRRRIVRDVYLDTADFRLYRAGVACRLRIEGRAAELSLKSLAPAVGALASRDEWREPLAGVPPLPLRRLPGRRIAAGLRRLTPPAAVRPLFELRQQREVWRGRAPGGLRVAVSADCVQWGAAAPETCEFELELLEGDPDALRKLGKRLQKRLGLHPAPGSKFEAGLRVNAVIPPAPPSAVPALADTDSFGVAVFRILRTEYELMRWNLPGTLLGLDPEKLHDLRVATRRLAAALRIFAMLLPARTVADFRCELRWLLRHLGAIRDLDVFTQHLAVTRDALPPEQRPALDALLARLRKRLQQRRRSLERLLRSARFERLRRNLERFLTAGAVAPAQRRMAAVPFAAVTPELVRRSLRKALRYGRRLKASSPHMDLHALRRRCRRLRYLGEFFHALYGRPLRKLVRRAEACQDALGRLQDAIVACSMIRRFRRAAQRKLFDLLESHFLEYALDSRREFQQAWSRLARKSMRQKALKQIRRRTRKPGRIQADSSG